MKIFVIFAIFSISLTKVSCVQNPEIQENLIEKECNSELMKILDKFDKKFGEINLFSGAKIVKNLNEKDLYSKVYGLSDRQPDCSDQAMNKRILAKLISIISSRSLNLKLTSYVDSNETLARGSKIGGGGKKGTEYLLAAGAMMKGMLATMAMGAIAGIAGKALMTGLMALTLSAIVGLKSLTSDGHKKTTYEIIGKPAYSHSQSHSTSHENHGQHGYYARSLPS